MAFASKIRPYAVITLDLGSARTDAAQGSITLRGVALGTWRVNTLTILTLGGGTLSARLNDTSNDLIPISNGQKIEGIPITEIYWTNEAQADLTAKVFAAWVD